MIYNLVQYLKNQFSTETIYCNQIVKKSTQDIIPDRKVLVKESPSGQFQMKTKFIQQSIQVIVFDIDIVKSRELIYNIFNEISDRNGLLLPAVTVNSVLYPQLETACTKAMQTPYSLGFDESGLFVWTVNFIVKYTGD